MIKGINIHKSFGNVEVLKGVDLEIKKGEVVSIVGDSGAGKTTLLQILGSLDIADSGNVLIDNVDLSSLSKKKLAQFRNENIGFIFQFHHLLPEFNALENVLMPTWIGKQGMKKKKRAIEILEFMGLSHRINHKPNQLSGGEQQRVAVARAIINNPKVLFADEPSGNLDSKNAEELHDLFFKLREDFGQTIVLVTHNESLADRADRKLVMKDGVIC